MCGGTRCAGPAPFAYRNSGDTWASAVLRTVWALALVAAGRLDWAWALLAVRMAMATASGWFVLRSPDVLRMWVLIPLRDLYGRGAWLAGLFGKTVMWRGRTLTLDAEGRIRPE